MATLFLPQVQFYTKKGQKTFSLLTRDKIKNLKKNSEKTGATLYIWNVSKTLSYGFTLKIKNLVYYVSFIRKKKLFH